jgi:hypothetical protein
VTALVAVKSAFTKLVPLPSAVTAGSVKISVPSRIKPLKATAISREGWILRFKVFMPLSVLSACQSIDFRYEFVG